MRCAVFLLILDVVSSSQVLFLLCGAVRLPGTEANYLILRGSVNLDTNLMILPCDPVVPSGLNDLQHINAV